MKIPKISSFERRARALALRVVDERIANQRTSVESAKAMIIEEATKVWAHQSPAKRRWKLARLKRALPLVIIYLIESQGIRVAGDPGDIMPGEIMIVSQRSFLKKAS
jgi:hypothetical protein